MMSKEVEGTWIRMGGDGRLRGEWFNRGRLRPEVQPLYLFIFPFWQDGYTFRINLGYWETAYLPVP